MKVYLSGGMEHAKNEGRNWRMDLDGWVRKQLGHDVFNPNVESDRYFRSIGMSSDEFRELKNADVRAYQNHVRHLVDVDSREIAELTDYLVCYWDESAAKGAGTKGELTLAHFFRKPVYVVTSIPIADIPGWVLGCTDELFPTFEELQTRLQAVFGPARG